MKNLIRTIDPSIFTKVTYDRVIYDALTDNVIVTGEMKVERLLLLVLLRKLLKLRNLILVCIVLPMLVVK